MLGKEFIFNNGWFAGLALFAVVVFFMWVGSLVKRGGSDGEKKGWERLTNVATVIFFIAILIFTIISGASKLLGFFE